MPFSSAGGSSAASEPFPDADERGAPNLEPHAAIQPDSCLVRRRHVQTDAPHAERSERTKAAAYQLVRQTGPPHGRSDAKQLAARRVAQNPPEQDKTAHRAGPPLNADKRGRLKKRTAVFQQNDPPDRLTSPIRRAVLVVQLTIDVALVGGDNQPCCGFFVGLAPRLDGASAAPLGQRCSRVGRVR